MVQQLWAPWRLSYVTGDNQSDSGCVLCSKGAATDHRDALVLAKGQHCYVVLNLFPYNNGHTMIVPLRHVADLDHLTNEEQEESQTLIRAVIRAMRTAMGPGGFNVGLNLGEAAGAGIASHLHWHVVPRWQGDTNFMPVLADVKVMPQHLTATWELLQSALAHELSQLPSFQQSEENS